MIPISPCVLCTCAFVKGRVFPRSETGTVLCIYAGTRLRNYISKSLPWTEHLTVGAYMDVQKISALMVVLVLYFPYSQAQGTYGRESTIYKK